jgi:anti-sigma B factor antagonist
MKQLRIDMTEDPYGLRLEGEIDLATAPALKDALIARLTEGKPITLDMKGVTFVDSSGVQVILAAAVGSHSEGTVIMKDPSAAVLRVMELIGIEAIPQIDVSVSQD